MTGLDERCQHCPHPWGQHELAGHDSLRTADHADLIAARNHLLAAIDQCDHLARNSISGSEDRYRFCLISAYARKAVQRAERGFKRYERERVAA